MIKKFFDFVRSKNIKSFNIDSSSKLYWLTYRIVFRIPVLSKIQWRTLTQKVKTPQIELFSDLSSKSKHNVLILPSKLTTVDIGKLVLECKRSGLRAWILNSSKNLGNLHEFQLATSFIKDKPIVIACDTWYNIVQDSPNFDTALIIDPKIDVSGINRKIKEEYVSKRKVIENAAEGKADEEKKRMNTIKKDLEFENIPEFKGNNKKLFLYLPRQHDSKAINTNYPGVIEKKGLLRSEPFGSNEYFIIKILKDHADFSKH